MDESFTLQPHSTSHINISRAQSFTVHNTRFSREAQVRAHRAFFFHSIPLSFHAQIVSLGFHFRAFEGAASVTQRRITP